jgi:hypothetical protein
MGDVLKAMWVVVKDSSGEYDIKWQLSYCGYDNPEDAEAARKVAATAVVASGEGPDHTTAASKEAKRKLAEMRDAANKKITKGLKK